ncbi:HAMP domain-containing histidine kinase [Anabaena cylindrica FACHB-243]|uniref:histidine kinase n=1 Tax=Anabaena cylindrica (strain ATCC 27899 / PCC 7122) TaxID=272123 RepID=K9ZEU6_ANACC|nr:MULTISPECIES: HAMP domain-containing sensor histidine kinase [Anabaena]AFZ56895.1 histidine kinase [Anabaena cylindrica PCC 7122]MBD2418434.1 HAMP domain-containing histidine kinase [Anabaena cylindrica FACHB-243]MBY5284883.1 HAMP domain-containing histidine kinase [Anabaena sp. CCAP 1446/1C]MBY5307657.1 HAMP domain-containing histidine kinase [Anabaena sp. CCAP 1446/1C]MCM2409381.1 HAMP domain-containing histidine kinase [Anabaena sp. CCAP 1446/1C]
MYEWILPSLREVLAQSQSSMAGCSSAKAEQQWRISLAATEHLLLNNLATVSPEITQGLVLTAPAPLFSQPKLTQSLQTVTFTAKPFNPLALMPFHVAPVTSAESDEKEAMSAFRDTALITGHAHADAETILPLLPADPLGSEQFCLVFTEKFRLVLVLSADRSGKKEFLFSFEPEVVQQAWRSLGARVILTNPELFAELDMLVETYSPIAPSYHTIIQFSQLLLQELAEPETDKAAYTPPIYPHPHIPVSPSPKPSSRPDVELLQAFAHEVRTPLTTIRTLTRLLLKRRDLPTTVTNRLEVIDHECTEQIDRMELLFKAAELETCTAAKSANTQLTPMSLDQVLQQSIPRWQQAAHRRNLTLDVALPQQLPTVVSNPAMLDRVLTGLMENFTRSLPPGSSIQVQVIPAGDQLKLQLTPQLDCQDATRITTLPIRKSLGQLLMFQPETGTISLNIAATKHLFQAIGGKLIVRQSPDYGEVLTIFLPLEVSKAKVGFK